MRTLRLSRRAQIDLETIWNYTIAEFGEDQAEHYLSAIEEGLALLLEFPEIGKPADHIRAGYRAFMRERHVIYYQIAERAIDVFGVLHERMDPEGKV